jgi:hypothetical protein
MTDNSILTPPGGPASLSRGHARPGQAGPAVLTAVLIVAASVLVGLIAGAIWAAAAPRVVYQVYTLNPPTAYATNPETNAFIAGDGWYCFVAIAGGALIGLAGYLFGVRRYGPVAMAGIVIGSVAAAFIAAWVGHLLSGAPGFDHLLATSKPGAFLHAPISLGSHGAIAFWPLAAAGVAGGIELLGVLKARRQASYGGTRMPDMESFGVRSYSDRPAPGPPGAGPADGNHHAPGDGQPGSGQPGNSQPATHPDGHGAPGPDGGAGRIAP